MTNQVVFDLLDKSVDPIHCLTQLNDIADWMREHCHGPEYISIIGNDGKPYPKVEWWTTVGMSLQLFPVEVSSERFEFGNGFGYEAKIEVRRGDQVVTAASAICTSDEKAWGYRDQYAVKSMATTRATSKAFRIGFSSIAVAAGLQPTPSDEVPPEGFELQESKTSRTSPIRQSVAGAPVDEGHGICDQHQAAFGRTPNQISKNLPVSHRLPDNRWCHKPRPKYDQAMEDLKEIFPDQKEQQVWVENTFYEEWHASPEKFLVWSEDQWEQVSEKLAGVKNVTG